MSHLGDTADLKRLTKEVLVAVVDLLRAKV